MAPILSKSKNTIHKISNRCFCLIHNFLWSAPRRTTLSSSIHPFHQLNRYILSSRFLLFADDIKKYFKITSLVLTVFNYNQISTIFLPRSSVLARRSISICAIFCHFIEIKLALSIIIRFMVTISNVIPKSKTSGST